MYKCSCYSKLLLLVPELRRTSQYRVSLCSRSYRTFDPTVTRRSRRETYGGHKGNRLQRRFGLTVYNILVFYVFHELGWEVEVM